MTYWTKALRFGKFFWNRSGHPLIQEIKLIPLDVTFWPPPPIFVSTTSFIWWQSRKSTISKMCITKFKTDAFWNAPSWFKCTCSFLLITIPSCLSPFLFQPAADGYIDWKGEHPAVSSYTVNQAVCFTECYTCTSKILQAMASLCILLTEQWFALQQPTGKAICLRDSELPNIANEPHFSRAAHTSPVLLFHCRIDCQLYACSWVGRTWHQGKQS